MGPTLHRSPGAYRLWRAARLSPPVRALARLRQRRVTRGRLARHALAAQAADPSDAAEWPYLVSLLERLDLLDGDGYAVDVGAGDGANASCTLPLFRDHGWSGLAVECDDVRFSLLSRVHPPGGRVRLARHRITPASAPALLREHGVPREPTLLNVDIDSWDLAVAEAIAAEFRPLVVDIEINEKVPPPLRFAVTYAPGRRWDEGHCYGCSIAAAADVLGAAGYRLEGLQYNNAFFVRDDVAERSGLAGLSAEAAYRWGYVKRTDRLRLFPWNADMEDLLTAAPEEAERRLRRRLARHAGHFLLQREPLRTAAAADVP